jgi:hypothetical protein
MKKITTYQCEICHTNYADPKDALSCEAKDYADFQFLGKDVDSSYGVILYVITGIVWIMGAWTTISSVFDIIAIKTAPTAFLIERFLLQSH